MTGFIGATPPQQMPMWNDLIARCDINGYLSIIVKVLTK